MRYALGVALPYLAKITGPLSGLDDATAETGFHALNADGEAAMWAAANGWEDVIAYRAGKAPMVEPPMGHDYVLLGTRSGPDDSIDTSDPMWQGALLWIEPLTPASVGQSTGGAPKIPPLGGAAPPEEGRPWWHYALGAGVIAAGVGLLVVASDDDER